MTPVENTRSARSMTEDVASLLRKANWGHPLCLAMVVFTAVALYDRPVMSAGFATLFCAQIVLRLFLIEPVRTRQSRIGRVWIVALVMLCGVFWGFLAAWICFALGYNRRDTQLRLLAIAWMERFRSRQAEAWRFCVLAVLIATGGLWGLLAAWSGVVFGYGHPNTHLILLYLLAIAIAGSKLFVHDLVLSRVFLAVLFAPPVLIHGLYPDVQRWIPFCALACFGVWLSVRVARLHLEREKGLSRSTPALVTP
jgi:hypothetical protein